MEHLTDGQLRALRNLVEKHSGNVTAFLNIADAQHLVSRGFASRSGQGWDVTAAGIAHLADLGPGPEESALVIDLHKAASEPDA